MKTTTDALSGGANPAEAGYLTMVIIIALFLGAGFFMYLHTVWNAAITFDRPQLAELATRGAGMPAPKYSREELVALSALFRKETASAFASLQKPGKRSWFGPNPSQWIIGMSLQELPDNSLSMQITARGPSGARPDQEWNFHFKDADMFRSEMPAKSASIAGVLASQKPKKT